MNTLAINIQCMKNAKVAAQLLALLLIATMTTLVMPVNAVVLDTVKWNFDNATLPYALADYFVSYYNPPDADHDTEDAFFILTGGCNSPEGNQREIGNNSSFACRSITNDTLAFYPFTNQFKFLASAPRPRTRHSAVFDDDTGKLWLIGGRDLQDNLIEEVDVYDPLSNTWSTPGKLPPNIACSDLAAFYRSSTKQIYMLGGYALNYTAYSATYALNMSLAGTQNSSSLPVFQYETKADLIQGRGDINIAVLHGYVYVTGGYTNVNNFCAPLRTTERYSITKDQWIELEKLTVGRGDYGLAVLNGRIFVIGGETKGENCTSDNPGSISVPVDDVEMLDPSQGLDTKWVFMTNIPTDRYRFEAVTYPPKNVIYAFGGQGNYNANCSCFPTSNVITFMNEVFVDAGPSAGANGAGSSAAGRNILWCSILVFEVAVITALLMGI